MWRFLGPFTFKPIVFNNINININNNNNNHHNDNDNKIHSAKKNIYDIPAKLESLNSVATLLPCSILSSHTRWNGVSYGVIILLRTGRVFSEVSRPVTQSPIAPKGLGTLPLRTSSNVALTLAGQHTTEVTSQTQRWIYLASWNAFQDGDVWWSSKPSTKTMYINHQPKPVAIEQMSYFVCLYIII